MTKLDQKYLHVCDFRSLLFSGTVKGESRQLYRVLHSGIYANGASCSFNAFADKIRGHLANKLTL